LVIEPELDVWMWGSENMLQILLGWNKPATIRDWLRSRECEFDAKEKPIRPKEALEAVLKELRIPYSSALYGRIASKISLHRCSDPAFQRLREIVQGWFPA
jgi:hypothetical protein